MGTATDVDGGGVFWHVQPPGAPESIVKVDTEDKLDGEHSVYTKSLSALGRIEELWRDGASLSSKGNSQVCKVIRCIENGPLH